MSEIDIAAILRELSQIDWEEMALIAKLSPEERVARGMRKSEAQKRAYQDQLRRKYPFLSEAEIKMKTLADLTPVNLPKDHHLNPEKIEKKIATKIANCLS